MTSPVEMRESLVRRTAGRAVGGGCLAAAGRRARQEGGFGLVELLIAMIVLNVGIFAVLSAFSSGYVTINRTRAISSASALEDAQMERFRALTFATICLSTTSTNTAYTAGAPEGTAVPTCSTTDPALVALRDPATGPDGRSYRIDTHIVWRCTLGTLSVSSPYSTAAPGCLTSGLAVSTAVKLVRIAVRDHTDTSKVYARLETTFDQSTGA